MIRIGKIVATHGVNGSLIMTHVAGNKTWLKKGHALMVEMQKGSMIPYFVSQCKAVNDEEYIVELEDISSPQDAKRLVTKHVYADEKLLSGIAKQSPLLWIGFTVIDAHYGNIGMLQDVMQAGAQWIGRIIHNDNEVLIPIVPETIKSVDMRSKIMKTNLPDGLLEVYQQ